MHASASRWYALVSIVAVMSLGGCDGVTDPTAASSSDYGSTAEAVTGRAGHVAVALANGRVLVAGGISGTTRLASAELFDPVSRSWSVAPSMAQPRLGHAAVGLADGRVLVLGGHSVEACAGAPVGNSAEIYDPASGAWSPAPSMSVARSAPAAVVLADGRVLLAGGGNRCGGVYPFAEIYDPATGRWAMTGSMHVARQAAAAVRLADGRVLMAGGVGSSPFASLATAEIYDPATGRWTLTGRMNAARQWGSVDVSASASLALLPDGRVLAAGGFDSCWVGCGFTLHAGAEIFDPTAGTWTLVAPMIQARSHHRLLALPSGHVLVAGGQDRSAPLGAAEVFDPASGTFVPAGSLVTPRYDHSVTSLVDGSVLIAQGQGSAGPLSSAEIFGFAMNRAPVANAGPDVTGDEGAQLAFSAAGSSDPDGDALSYSWDFGDGSAPMLGRDVRHAYADNGTYTVTLTVSDGNVTSTASTTARVANVAPAVSYVSHNPVFPGELYTGSGSFVDPGADVWTATVDYGDGSGVQPLTLNDREFELSHRYAAAGSYAVSVVVSDDDGGAGSVEFTVLVQSLDQALRALVGMLDQMASDGDLSQGHANSLAAKLWGAIQQLDRGNPAVAMNQLQALVNELNALVRARSISVEYAQSLLDVISRVMQALGAA